MLLVLLSVLTLLGILFSKQIIGLIVQDHFSAVPGKFDLTVRMSQIMFGFIFLMSTFAFFMGILNSLGEYKIPAMAPTFFNVAMIASNFFPKSWQTVEGDALAWGVIVGGFLQTAVLIPALIKKGYLPKPKWDFGNRDSLRVWVNMLPGMLGTGLLQITTIINTNFASSLGEGSNTYIYLADRLLELPLSLVAVSLGTALLPTLASEYTNGRKQNMIDTLSYYLRVNLYVCLPAAVGLLILAYPITKILFGRGEFIEADVMATKNIVMVYALTLIVSSSVRVLVPGFYAIKNTWLPSTVSLISIVAHVLIAPILMKKYQIVGLVASTALSGFINLVLVYVSYRFMVGPLGLWTLVKRLILFLVPLSGVAVVCLLGQYAFSFSEGFFSGVGILISVLLMAAYIYFKISKTMELEEYKTSFAKLFFLLRHI
jgi:putative peptidoglycan lipid II flippase